MIQYGEQKQTNKNEGEREKQKFAFFSVQSSEQAKKKKKRIITIENIFCDHHQPRKKQTKEKFDESLYKYNHFIHTYLIR